MSGRRNGVSCAGDDDGGKLEPARATVTRLRLGLEGSRPIRLGGGLALGDPKRDLKAQLPGRGLLSYKAKGFRERGFSGARGWRQKPSVVRRAYSTPISALTFCSSSTLRVQTCTPNNR